MVGEERWKRGFNSSNDLGMNSSTKKKRLS